MSADPDERIRQVRRALLLDRIQYAQREAQTAPESRKVQAWLSLLHSVEKEIVERSKHHEDESHQDREQ